MAHYVLNATGGRIRSPFERRDEVRDGDHAHSLATVVGYQQSAQTKLAQMRRGLGGRRVCTDRLDWEVISSPAVIARMV